MDVTQFQIDLLHELSNCEFVDYVDFKTESFIFKGRIILKNGLFLQVYFNEHTGTMAFALIKGKQRIWGLDFDNLRGWHLHPLEDSESHIDIEPKEIKEIILLLKEIQ